MKRNPEKNPLSYLGEKRDLLTQYLSATSEFMQALKKEKRFDASEPFILKRQSLIQEIEALDRSFHATVGSLSQRPNDPSEVSREAVRESLEAMRRVLAEVESKDKALNLLAKEESEALMGELLRLRTARNAAQGYGRAGWSEPRFLDTRK